jgi:hypothetical protein
MVSGKVDVVITVGSITFGHNVDAHVSVDMLQRIAGNEARMTLKGYWVPIIIRGEGYVGRLCPHDQILMYPGAQEDIDKIRWPRTTSSAGIAPVPRRTVDQASIGPNFLTRQLTREPFVPWTE